jgi:hypothetical protein
MAAAQTIDMTKYNALKAANEAAARAAAQAEGALGQKLKELEANFGQTTLAGAQALMESTVGPAVTQTLQEYNTKFGGLTS